jgi:dipeptidyl aminopeptidase/acylaminoacyl peptidase
MRTTGEPIPVGENVWFFRATGNAAFAVSENGTVAHHAGPNPTRLVWRDRSGREIGVVGAPALFGRPRLSPDGSSIAVEVADPRNGTRDVWIYDSERGLPRRVTAVSTDAVSAVWSPAGDRIAFGSGGESALDIYVKDVNGTGTERLLLRQKGVQLPLDWSPDGSRIVYVDMSPGRSANRQLWVLSLTGKPEAAPLLRTPFSAFAARYSPDGEWIAFVSEESGRSEVYVIPSGGQGSMLPAGALAVITASQDEPRSRGFGPGRKRGIYVGEQVFGNRGDVRPQLEDIRARRKNIVRGHVVPQAEQQFSFELVRQRIKSGQG